MTKFFCFFIIFWCISLNSCTTPAVQTVQIEQENECIQELVTIDSADIEKHIRFLASDELEGRLADSEGERKAANYILSHFQAIESELLYDEGYQIFPFNRWIRVDSNDVNAGIIEEEIISRGSGIYYKTGALAHGTNVVAMIRGTKNSEEYIVVGAHYDHLGTRGFGETKMVYYGADDNASGVAVLIESAKFIAKKKPERNVIFVAFSAEERGMHGSKYFVQNPPVPKENIVAMINIDMVGHLDSVLIVAGVHTAVEFDALISETETGSGFQVEYNSWGFRLSDHYSFYVERIPVLWFRTFTDTKQVKHYHRLSDTPDLINFSGVTDITMYVSQLVLHLAQEGQTITVR
ncbi:MAG: M20/M25/M40 family metallo-hydrolase [Bacteroidales bacterium]|nr:M20/M25/M40 family metallo-hydrolase [Bacteroidales bacterium]